MLFRRAEGIVGTWSGPAFLVRNYLDRRTVMVDRLGADLLTAAGYWRSLRELERTFPDAGVRRLRATVSQLVEAGALERSDASGSRRTAFDAWQAWGPAAHLHFDSKDPSWASPGEAAGMLETWSMTDPAPQEARVIDGTPLDLPASRASGSFPSVLLSRRSWRRFGREGLTLEQLATLLGLTWGTQQWVHLRKGRFRLKTYPSPGACHALEAYVAVQRVKGLRRGLYHYQADSHQLVRLPARIGNMRKWMVEALGGQAWFGPAAAVVFMTAVFPRVQWKYRSSRAYRTVLMEAGHACQTFCLAATWLRLAPFCTAALADSRIERALGVDGMSEGVLYAAGVGVRPPATAWAPFPRRRAPSTSRPKRQAIRS